MKLWAPTYHWWRCPPSTNTCFINLWNHPSTTNFQDREPQSFSGKHQTSAIGSLRVKTLAAHVSACHHVSTMSAFKAADSWWHRVLELWPEMLHVRPANNLSGSVIILTSLQVVYSACCNIQYPLVDQHSNGKSAFSTCIYKMRGAHCYQDLPDGIFQFKCFSLIKVILFFNTPCIASKCSP